MGNSSGMPPSFDYAPFSVNGTNLDPNFRENTGLVSALMFASGVLGNMLALIVLIYSSSGHKKTIFYRLVAGLTVTDLVGTSLTSPVVIAVYASGNEWIGGKTMCYYFGYVMIFAGYATMLIICSMSVERVLCIRYPCFYRARSSPKHATVILTFCWALASFIASFPFLGFGKMVLQYPNTWCFFDYYNTNPVNKAFNYFYAIFAILIISITTCFNLTALCTLLNRCRNNDSLKGCRQSCRKCRKSHKYTECQMLSQLAGITLAFSTCYIPLMIKILINQNETYLRNYGSDFTVIRLASVNQILDPWVYILLRRELLWKVISCFKKHDNNDTVPSVFQKAARSHNYEQSFCSFCFDCLCDPHVNMNNMDVKRSLSDLRLSVITSVTPPDVRRTILKIVSEDAINASNCLINSS
ncbi:prostaglandin E receptor 4 [Mytilus galloprovincialis]|uniref:Thromboxane A2 receptor n=1 Tax=Mytilus galloprovincialis TaxID=29158 RepID=A0A8B6FPP1_MYTGA|nr:prostaglandin E receptor 4 [Mytilus galloprovincialis]